VLVSPLNSKESTTGLARILLKYLLRLLCFPRAGSLKEKPVETQVRLHSADNEWVSGLFSVSRSTFVMPVCSPSTFQRCALS